MNELNWRIFKFTIVLTSIGLFFTALCILDACIRSYWIKKQQRLPRYGTEEILNIRNLVKVDKLFDVERENPRLFFCKPPFNWSWFPKIKKISYMLLMLISMNVNKHKNFSYKWIIMLEKCRRPGINVFNIKLIIGNHGNWKNQNPGGRFGATS